MNRNIEHLIGLPINILTLGFCIPIIHHEMVDEDESIECVIKASFSTFKKDFEKVKWKISSQYRNSLFTEDMCSEFHASIIKINDVGYKLTTYGFIRANILRRKKIKELNKKYYNLLNNE